MTDDEWEDRHWAKLEAAAKAKTDACEHQSHRDRGRIICVKCKGVWHLGLKGAVWMPPEVRGDGLHQ
jgi:hypothetical protein